MIIDLSPDIAPYCSSQGKAFDEVMQMDGDDFRCLNGRTTKRIHIGEKAYFIKQHRGVGWREMIKNWLQLKWPVVSAKNEWRALKKLSAIGIKAPCVLGFGERGFNIAKRESFVILEAIEPAMSLEQLTASWREERPAFAWKLKLIHAVSDIAGKMHAAGIHHRDFYICHFLLRDEILPLYLIDLHRAQLHHHIPLRLRIKDLAGLYFSTKRIGLTKRDRLRFMKRYSGQSLRTLLQTKELLWKNVQRRGEQLYRDHF